MNLGTLGLYGHTLGRMEPAQLLGMVRRKATETCVPRLPVDVDARYERAVPDRVSTETAPIGRDLSRLRDGVSADDRRRFRRRAREAAAGELRLLNRSLDVDPPRDVDWSDPRFDRFPLLWRLQLYGFEPLRWAVLGFDDPAAAPAEVLDTFDAWVDDWCRTAAIGGPNYLRRAWTPWAVSLRVQTLARYLAWRQGAGTPADGDVPAWSRADVAGRELYKNALFLANHVETDVGGNHLVENGAALLTAGVALPDADADWVEVGLSVLGRAGARQFLDDGCHFERSPMYHVLVTTRYVTACSLLAASDRQVPAWLREMTRLAVAFLQWLRPPDGRIPLLNDAVFDQALPLDACLGYASAAGLGPDEVSEGRPSPAGERLSGYRWLDTDAGRLLVDGGPVGPPHLPGHSHNDLLSVLLWCGKRRLLTDTGTYDYAAGDRRQRSRSVAGHNTVQVGDSEPIPIGGRYLMGARTAPTTRYRAGSPAVFEGWYRTASRAPASYQHRRTIVAGEDWWLVWDDVSGPETETAPVTSRLHTHPDATVAVADDGRVSVSWAGETDPDGTAAADPDPLLTIRTLGADSVGTTETEYYPRFGVARPRTTIELRRRPSDGPVSMGVLLRPPDVGGPSESAGVSGPLVDARGWETPDSLPTALADLLR